MPRIGVPTSLVEELQRRLNGLGVTDVHLDGLAPDGSGPDLSALDAAVRWDLSDDGLGRLLSEGRSLRWLHSSSAGVETWPTDEIAARGIVLTNAAGVFAIPLAEWVLAVMLRVVTRADAAQQAQREHRWEGEAEHDELFGKTVLVLGPGGIGAEIISRAAAFGMQIWAANRSGRRVPGAHRVVRGDAWRDLLENVDFLVSTLPLTEETRLMLGAAEFDALPSDAWVINVGRGATIDEDALFDALEAGTLGGAALDAWTTEPLPAEHRAWDTPNVIVSPHSAGTSLAGRGRGLALFAENVARFARGEPLRNQVDLSAGY
jgi:phosphoglycerate dehydrogenase-like enzyme